MSKEACEEAGEPLWLERQYLIRLTAHRLSIESAIKESRNRTLRSRALLQRPIYRPPDLGFARVRSANR